MFDAGHGGIDHTGWYHRRELSGSGEKTLAQDGIHPLVGIDGAKNERGSRAAFADIVAEKESLRWPNALDVVQGCQRCKTCAYVSIDATGVRQQGHGGKAAEGRMPYVAMVFNPVPDLPVGHPHRLPANAEMQARYLAGLYTLEELGVLLRRQAGQVGMNKAEQWIGLSDGGNGLENFLKTNFPGP